MYKEVDRPRRTAIRERLWSFVSLLTIGCASTAAQPPAQPGASTTTEAHEQSVLGSLNGVPIRRSEVDGHVGSQLRDVRNEYEQRRMHLLWAGLEDAVAKRLLEVEAKRRDISVRKLVDQEVESTASAPTPEQVQAYYDEHQALINLPFDVAAPQIAAQITRERRSKLWQQLVNRLRAQADVRYALPVPTLPRYEVDAGQAPHKGPADAKVTLVEFSDFQCGYCAQARLLLDKLSAIYPDALRIVYRDFPLAQHPRARHAAEAAQCAHEQNKFWPYHDLLFENAHGLDDDALRRYATTVDLSLEEFEGCMASERPRAAVDANEEAARRYGVQGTPALFLNGIKLVGLLPLPIMQALIDRELEGTR